MGAVARTCSSCGAQPPEGARFCHVCGSPVAAPEAAAEFKQVTVLFADVVQSMDIAAAVGAERLRDIMAELLDRCATVVHRYGGTVDKFTGDGVMAVFGAPIALEDHAFRACVAALGIQGEVAELSAQVRRRDGIAVQVRIGLNSGQVIAGDIGSGAASYTAIGEQVGMAQRMESVAPAGGVMLSDSTSRLVENTATLGEPELVRIKGNDTPVSVRRLLGIGERQSDRRGEARLVGRNWEVNTVAAILEEAIDGAGCIVNITGPAGIGKSRLVRETAAIAAARGVPVFAAHCESHTGDIPFHTAARLLRAGLDLDKHDPVSARAATRARFADADIDDLLLLDDLLGIRDPSAALPDLGPDARRRRLTALINAAVIARGTPAVYVIEDAHWIDESSESLLTALLAVIPRTPSLVLVTYRPEYQGALARVSGAQTVGLRPLRGAQACALSTELLGSDPSVGLLSAQLADRAAGNPFFAEEMVRDLAERGVLCGRPGAYRLQGDPAGIDVPATLQSAIGARIDRLDSTAKHTLNAASVIGARFDADQLAALIGDADIAPLIEAELVDQVGFTGGDHYAFRHALIRTVAYESQLKSARARLHRSVAEALQQQRRESADEHAALIAEHYETAGDLRPAFVWHMRAANWWYFRDIGSAHASWRRARELADRLPADDPDQSAMRIAPRTMLSGTAYMVGGSGAETGFDELRELCAAVGDQRSLAIGMAGLVMHHLLNTRCQDAWRVAAELVELLDAIADPTLTAALSVVPMAAMDEAGQIAELLRLADRVIALTGGDPTMGAMINGSPLTCALAYRGVARCYLGLAGWRDDFRRVAVMAREFDPTVRASATMIVFRTTLLCGVSLADDAALQDTADTLAVAEAAGEDLALDLARLARGYALAHRDGPERHAGLALLAQTRERALNQRFTLAAIPADDLCVARERARAGDLDAAIELARAAFDGIVGPGGWIGAAPATAVQVESLLRRGRDGDLVAAQDAIDRLSAIPTAPGFVHHELALLRLRALLARAHGDEPTYRELAQRYRDRVVRLGFDGQLAQAEAML